MRKIIVMSMITLDGVMQSPGGLKEDTTGNFIYGGWASGFYDEADVEAVKADLKPAAYLLGRKTFEAWAEYWPHHGDFWPGINEGTKYVFSKNMEKSDPAITGWQNSLLINNLADISALKNMDGLDIHVWGSGKLVQLLLKNDLVDELKLKIYPLTLGVGKKLFEEGTIPAAFTLKESFATSSGVIIASYKRAGEVKTGNIEAK